MSEGGSAARRKSASRKRQFCEMDRSFVINEDERASDGEASEVEDTIEMELDDISDASPMIGVVAALPDSEPVRSNEGDYIREESAGVTEMGISDGRGVSVRLKEDCYIQERVERTIAKRDTPIGIVAHSYGTAAWQLGSLGSVKWIVSPYNLPARSLDDPPWFPTTKALPSVDVSVVLIQGLRSLLDDRFWDAPTLQIVVAVHPIPKKKWKKCSRKRKRKRNQPDAQEELPDGWVQSTRKVVQHDEVGGVTDGRFVIDVCTRRGVVWNAELPPTVTGRLGDALSKVVTEGNQKHCPHPREDEANSWRGLLTWNERKDDVVVADSVFNKKGSVKRKITLKEWGRVLDFPECKTRNE